MRLFSPLNVSLIVCIQFPFALSLTPTKGALR